MCVEESMVSGATSDLRRLVLWDAPTQIRKEMFLLLLGSMAILWAPNAQLIDVSEVTMSNFNLRPTLEWHFTHRGRVSAQSCVLIFLLKQLALVCSFLIPFLLTDLKSK